MHRSFKRQIERFSTEGPGGGERDRSRATNDHGHVAMYDTRAVMAHAIWAGGISKKCTMTAYKAAAEWLARRQTTHEVETHLFQVI